MFILKWYAKALAKYEFTSTWPLQVAELTFPQFAQTVVAQLQ